MTGIFVDVHLYDSETARHKTVEIDRGAFPDFDDERLVQILRQSLGDRIEKIVERCTGRLIYKGVNE